MVIVLTLFLWIALSIPASLILGRLLGAAPSTPAPSARGQNGRIGHSLSHGY